MSLSDKLRKAKRKRRRKSDWLRRPEILLHPGIPQPLHGLAPRDILGRKWWSKTRQAAYRSTNYHCQACGVHKLRARGPEWLEGHEMYDIDYLLGRAVYVKTVSLCHYCHNYIHSGRLLILLEEGRITQATYVAIIQHGDDVLGQAGLLHRKHQVYDGPIAEWGDWRLVLNGKEYKPKYRDIHAWNKAFGHDV